MKRTAVIGATVLACACSILDEDRVSISGHVSLDGEPAVGWYVELLDPRIASLSTEPFPIFPGVLTNDLGDYHLEALRQDCEDLAVSVSPPDDLVGLVTPATAGETDLCGRSEANFSFSSTPAQQ